MNQQVFKDSKLVKFLKKTIKRGLANQGINPVTRAGDRKLEFLVKQLVKNLLSPLTKHKSSVTK